MALREIEYKASRLWDLRGNLPDQPFATIDPGVHGALVIYGCADHARDRKPLRIAPLSIGDDALIRMLRDAGVRLVFIEAQHMKMNASAVIKLARRAAVLAAILAGVHLDQGLDVTLVWVHPASWQAVIRDLKKQGHGTKESAQVVAAGLLDGDGRWIGATAKQREGIADALCMAVWVSRTFW